MFAHDITYGLSDHLELSRMYAIWIRPGARVLCHLPELTVTFRAGGYLSNGWNRYEPCFKVTLPASSGRSRLKDLNLFLFHNTETPTIQILSSGHMHLPT